MSMTGRRRVVAALAVVVTLVGALAWFMLRPGNAPHWQPPLVTLDPSSLNLLREDFNRHSNQTRIIVLLSPT